MVSQPQNPEFRINHEAFHPCSFNKMGCLISCNKMLHFYKVQRRNIGAILFSPSPTKA